MVLTIKAPDMLSEDEYVRRSLECEFIHQKEERNHQSDPAYSSIPKDLELKQYLKVILAGKQILQQFPDFDLPYKWIANAYRQTNQYNEARAILSEGLLRSRRKVLLLTDMGEIECELANIEAAIYWWCQALAGLSLDPIDFGVYLFLGAVAQGVDYKGLSARLLNRADILYRSFTSCKCCHIRLDPDKEKSIVELVLKSKINAVRSVLEGLYQIYYF